MNQWRVFALLLTGSSWSSAARGADLAAVEGTRWQIEAPASWSGEARALVADLAPRLPPEYRSQSVRLRLAEAQEVQEGRAHTLAELGPFGDVVTLYARGLPDRLQQLAGEGWSDSAALEVGAGYLLQRAIVHELTHRLDRRAGWSATPAWRGISGWSWLSFVPGPLPRAASGEFAAPYGARSPAEDLATFAEVYFLPPDVGPLGADRHPRCRWPSKDRFFREHLGEHSDPAPNVRCSTATDVGLTPDRISAVEILWATPTMSSAAAIGGHLLLLLRLEGTAAQDTFAMLADPGGVAPGGFTYVALGLMGGFPARIVRAPYETTVLRYLEEENRDVLRFRWELDEEEEGRLLARLDDLALHWQRPYYFFLRNCSALIVELANAVEDRPVRTPPVVPPDLVLAELARRGRITLLPPDAARDLAPATHARLLRPRRAEVLGDVCGASFRDAESPDPARRSAAYDRMLAHVVKTDRASCWSRLAEVMALSASLESAERALGEASLGGQAARLAVREHVPVAERQAWSRTMDALVTQRYRDEIPEGAAARHTPYVPVTGGAMWLQEPGDDGTPMAFVRREGIDLTRGERRMFGPARGVDATFSSIQMAIGWDAGLNLYAREQLLHFRYVPERLVRGPTWGLGVDLLDADAHLGAQRGRARWAGVDGVVSLLRSGNGASYLEATAGLAVGSDFRLQAGRLRARTHASAPVRLEGALQTDGRLAVGLASTVGWIPMVDAAGAWSQALSLAARGSVHLGEVARAGVRLEAEFEHDQMLVGTARVGPTVATLGLRVERW